MRFLLEGPGGIPGIKLAGGFTTNLPATFGSSLTVSGGLATNTLALTNSTTTDTLAITDTSATTGYSLNIAHGGGGGTYGAVLITGSASRAGASGQNLVSIIENATSGTNAALAVADLNSNGSYPSLLVTSARVGSGALQLNNVAANNGAVLGQINFGTQTISGAIGDGYLNALRITPTYSAATALAVTRHNYLDINNVAVAGAGPASVTDAAVMRFDAAAGTHKAVDGSSTKTTPGGVNAWVKINVNGTIHYIPAYTSKTA